MRAHWNTWGRVSQAQKSGYGIDEMLCAWLLEMTGQGHWWMCRHVGTTLLHMHKGFSCLKGEADDHDVFRWCHCLYAYIGVGGYKREHTWAMGLSSGILVAVHSVSLCEEPQTLCCSYLSTSWGMRLQPYREVFFIYSTVSTQGYLGYPELVCFSCLQVKLGSLPPYVPRTWYWSGKDCNLLEQISACGINHNFGEPTNPISIPEQGHMHTHTYIYVMIDYNRKEEERNNF